MGQGSRWASVITPRQSQNGKGSRWAAVVQFRVNLAVNSKKETKGRVKMDQRSRWACVI